jgi:DNA-directed RNA polymerase subunit beta'
VDYSGRSVIVGRTRIEMHECGLQRYMAAELFKPFIIRKR